MSNYIEMLRYEYETLIMIARTNIANYENALEKYLYTEAEKARMQKRLSEDRADLAYYEKQLALMGGAVNEDTQILTETKVSESPQYDPKFGCVTGL